MDATIIVATYGNGDWLAVGNDTAQRTEDILQYPVIRVHGGASVAQCRNAGAALADTEWLCFLDAGDYLSFDYFNVMDGIEGDLFAPRLVFNYGNNVTDEPFDLTQRDIDHGNPCCIGTLIRKEMFDRVGGFWEEPAYEDWSLFRRAWLSGAKIVHTQAFYYAKVDPHGRNSTVADPIGLIKQIQTSHREWYDNITNND